MRVLRYADLHPPYVLMNRGDWALLLDELHQCRTYSGLLLGLPDERMVEERIERAMREASERLPAGVALHLIRPELVPFAETVADRTLSPDGSLGAPGAATRVEGLRLPLVTCIGLLVCPVPVGGGRAGLGGLFEYAALGAVWFQERFALPIAPEPLAALQSMDWDALASNVSA